MQRNMARPSGTLRLRKKRSTGNNIIARKKAISKGVITSRPAIIIVPRKKRPINSRDRRTVYGSCDIFQAIYVEGKWCVIKLQVIE